jgi:anti-sigma regulatory factor (Ser/Thr protein kinase)
MMSAMPWAHETALPCDPGSIAACRHFVGLHLLEHGLGSMVDDAQLVVSELATNAVVHARTPFVVVLSGVEGSVRLAVSDESSTVPSQATPDACALEDETGRGLWLVRHLSQDWGVTATASGDKTVWASFDLPSSPGSARLDFAKRALG